MTKMSDGEEDSGVHSQLQDEHMDFMAYNEGMDGILCQNGGHVKNIHLHPCKHKTVKLTLTLTLTDT